MTSTFTPDGTTQKDQPSPLPRSVFTLDEIQPKEKFSLWKESISFMFDVETDRETRNEDFRAKIDAHMFGHFVLARTKTKKQIWSRNEQVIARDGMNHFMIQIFESGKEWYERDGKQYVIEQDGLVVFDLSRTSKTWTNDFTNLSLILPRHMIEPHLRHPDLLHMRFLPATVPLVGLLYDHIISLKKQVDTINFQQAMEINPATIALAAACLNNMVSEKLPPSPHIDVALTMLARKTIEEQLHDVDLSADKLAAIMCISRSRLYEFFKPHGGVRSYIQQRRLKVSFKRLSDPAFAHRSISDIAYSTGFRNDSAFSQAFKKAFGMSPSDARIRNSQFYLSSNQVGSTDRRYEDWIKEL